MADRHAALTAILVGGAFLVGGFAQSRDVFPFPQLRQLRDSFGARPTEPPRFAIDDMGRLVADSQKQTIACAPAGPRTAVLLVSGQSNAANYAGQAYRSDHGERVQTFYGGKCFVAASPLLGADGIDGEYWTRAGNLLIESGAYDQVVIAVAAVGGTPIVRWAPGGDLHPLLMKNINDLKSAGLPPTHFLWVQGENDLMDGTTRDAYSQGFLSILAELRKVRADLPAFPGVATFCEGYGTAHRNDNPVADAQRALPEASRKIFPGADTDHLLEPLDRRDACHFGGTGSEKAAREWARIIAAHPAP